MDNNAKEFVLAYAALCRKHQLCIVPEAWHNTLLLASYDEAWVEEVVKNEGTEAYEAYQQSKEQDGH